jgi:biotin operon repressor
LVFLPTKPTKEKPKELKFYQPRKKGQNMNYLNYSEKMNYLLEMIKEGRLLSLKQASEKYNCSERTIKRMLKTLREQGNKIEYCKKLKKYFIKT